MELVNVLQISFDGLEKPEKSIFLDIACFFNGFDKDYILRIMDGCGFYPEIGIRVLVDKSLLHVSHDNKLWMHDLLQEMGKEIVREKSHKEPGRQSRLWDNDNLYHVLENYTATEEIEAIVCHSLDRKILSWEALSNMKKLRFFIIDFAWYLTVDDQSPNVKYIANELRFLVWHNFASEYLPSSFQPYELVELDLHGSNINQLWKNPIKPFYNLKLIDLSHSENFSKFEDFRMFPNLEKFILTGCDNLVEIHPSITFLERLTILDLNCCTSLENLPPSLDRLKSLKVLDLKYCSMICNLPEDLGHLSSLEELNVSGTAVKHLPSFIVLLKNLKTLSCGKLPFGSRKCKNLINTIGGKGLLLGGFNSLEDLDLSGCMLGKKRAFPKDFGCLVSLERLKLSNNHFASLQASINKLSKLKFLYVDHCKNLKSLGPELPTSIIMVWADHCISLDTFLDPLKECNLQCSASCLGCFDLVRRQGSKRTAIASLIRYLQKSHYPVRRFDIFLPGKEIPAWFTHRSFRTWISFQLDPNWCNSKWMGFALCVQFLPTKLSYLHCHVKVNGQDWGYGSVDWYITDKFYVNHLWILYLPRNIYFREEWLSNKCSQIQFSFSFELLRYPIGKKDGTNMFIKDCGMRLVYEEDIEDLDPFASNCSEFDDDWDDKWDRYSFVNVPPQQSSKAMQDTTLGKQPLSNLKAIDLSNSENFIKFEDFGVVPLLEKLILKGCSRLVEVHPSITLLTRLTLLNLNRCYSPKFFLTGKNGLKSLKVLQLFDCYELHKDLGHLNSLEELYLSGTSLRNSELRPGQWEYTLNIIVGQGLVSGCHYSWKTLDLSLRCPKD
ncbi:disease resistance protein RUN1-like [Ziziphus jujuba]|uniref:Disease resistance protein RUN1-like n=1 Tax=Ziziphus jujuba TaxID=326968 RepID=A0ABM3IHF4_ZIZJJ|nr:disease resistance protein RUN1-like [Ziziphus jujuba]